MYAQGEQWYSWIKDFRFGTLCFLPSGSLRQVADTLRLQYDPESAKTCAAHVTITQPFVRAPNLKDIQALQKVFGAHSLFEAQIGPGTTSPNKKLIWFDVNPKEKVLALREDLHGTKLFRTDLPLTTGFIPHLTISEKPREPEEVKVILSELNSKLNPWQVAFDSVSWIIPDENFVFGEHQTFKLSN